MLRGAPPRLIVPVLLLALSACGGGGGGGSTGQIGFSIQSSVPFHGAVGVGLDITLRATFTQPLDPTTVTAQSLVVSTTAKGVLPGITALVNDGQGRTLEWSGANLFDSGNLHSARAAPGLRSAGGDPVGQPSLFTFQTTFSAPPLGLPAASQLRRTNGNLGVGRAAHQATLLLDGRVLLTGGFSQGTTPTSSSEVYVPLTGAFAPTTQDLGVARASHTATRLSDGRVLVVGGWVETSPGQLSAAESAEIFSPLTGSWAAVGALHSARAEHAAHLLPNGTVLITGGSQITGQGLLDLDDAEVFDPGTGTFSVHPQLMLHARAAHAMVRLGNGRILLAGGSFTDLRTEWYDPARDLFEAIAPATQDSGRFGAVAAAYASGDAAVAGGDSLGTVVHCFTAFARMQSTGSGLSRPRAYATATPIGADRILIAGGIDFSRSGFLEASCDALIEGGLGGSRTFATELRFSHGMGQHTGTVLLNGDVLFCGGVQEDGFSANHAEAFLLDLTP